MQWTLALCLQLCLQESALPTTLSQRNSRSHCCLHHPLSSHHSLPRASPGGRRVQELRTSSCHAGEEGPTADRTGQAVQVGRQTVDRPAARPADRGTGDRTGGQASSQASGHNNARVGSSRWDVPGSLQLTLKSNTQMVHSCRLPESRTLALEPPGMEHGSNNRGSRKPPGLILHTSTRQVWWDSVKTTTGSYFNSL